MLYNRYLDRSIPVSERFHPMNLSDDQIKWMVDAYRFAESINPTQNGQQMMGQNRMPANFGGSVSDLFRDMYRPPQGGGTVFGGRGSLSGGPTRSFTPTPGLTIQGLAPMLQQFNPQSLMQFMPGATYPGNPVRNPNLMRRPGVGPTPY